MNTEPRAVTLTNAYVNDRHVPHSVILALRVGDAWCEYNLPAEGAAILADHLTLVARAAGVSDEQ
jgi:hypothetical protein